MRSGGEERGREILKVHSRRLSFLLLNSFLLLLNKSQTSKSDPSLQARMEASTSTSTAGPSQPVASGSGSPPPRRAPSPPPPAVLPFAPPREYSPSPPCFCLSLSISNSYPPYLCTALPKAHLTGSLDLLSHLSLLPSYDTYVRPYFRNPKAPVALPPGTGTLGGLAALTAEDKGKGRAVDGGAAGGGEGGGGKKNKGGGAQQQQQVKKVKDGVVDLKRMKGDFDDLVEECVVLGESERIIVQKEERKRERARADSFPSSLAASDHPSIHHPPSSFKRLIYEAPDEGTVPDWRESLAVLTPEQLEGWGWRLMEGKLAEVSLSSPTLSLLPSRGEILSS